MIKSLLSKFIPKLSSLSTNIRAGTTIALIELIFKAINRYYLKDKKLVTIQQIYLEVINPSEKMLTILLKIKFLETSVEQISCLLPGIK
jgi:hypothetical protein